MWHDETTYLIIWNFILTILLGKALSEIQELKEK